MNKTLKIFGYFAFSIFFSFWYLLVKKEPEKDKKILISLAGDSVKIINTVSGSTISMSPELNGKFEKLAEQNSSTSENLDKLVDILKQRLPVAERKQNITISGIPSEIKLTTISSPQITGNPDTGFILDSLLKRVLAIRTASTGIKTQLRKDSYITEIFDLDLQKTYNSLFLSSVGRYCNNNILADTVSMRNELDAIKEMLDYLNEKKYAAQINKIQTLIGKTSFYEILDKSNSSKSIILFGIRNISNDEILFKQFTGNDSIVFAGLNTIENKEPNMKNLLDTPLSLNKNDVIYFEIKNICSRVQPKTSYEYCSFTFQTFPKPGGFLRRPVNGKILFANLRIEK